MIEPVIIDAGTLEFSDADMTATGLLIPYGVQCRSNLGMFTFAQGDVVIPTDFTGMSLNEEHKRENVIGGFTNAWEQPEGTFATFKYADTPAGRQAYADGKSGKRKHLSAEVANVRIRAGKALPGGVLFAAAQVERPAFEGATLLAAEDTPSSSEWEDPNASRDSRYVTQFTDDSGVKWQRIEETTTTTKLTKLDDSDAPEDTDTDTENEPDKETTLNATATPEPTLITVPATFLGSAPRAKDGKMKAEDIDLGTVFASIAAIKNREPGAVEDAVTLLAALADITYNAPGGLTTADSGVLQPAWVGKLWQGRRYQRKYIDLGTHVFGGIQLGGRKGYTMTADGELVQTWQGNKADMPTGGASTDTRKSSLRKYGWAADIAREWFDLEGGADVLEELFKLVADSYARVTDQDALRDLFAIASRGAGAALSRRIAPDSLPAGTPANLAYYPAAVQLIQAIEVVTDADDTPTFAVVNPTSWKQLIYTPKDLLPEYVELSVGVGTGEASITAGSGKVIVKKAPQAFFPGTKATDPQTIAGAKGGIEFREHGTTPISFDAIDIARGGVDRANVGYLETMNVREESFAFVGTPA
ncbi:hypothetical protein SAMN04487848_2056 [Microbacterium sp. ru370.1]|uniref:hypothetical protein n=1 Tax=unclassified Microbacterium TaxID=2609290 RepID=UPI00088CB255|nr:MULTISPECIES: hypothetical protein [unclassified Microbacterium]SDO77668.1 hypothetical protein SAMN04487848_2056 [Microbacterium sp. ru370.1]SIT88928.1 hypothetical protein SAMN05880579_2051 [Microbacterium sp. RU1D]